MLPGALASAALMPLVGKACSRLDPRLLIGVGAVGVVFTMLLLGSLSPDTGREQLFWPLVLRGAATVNMFLPLSLATLGPLPKKDVSAASGFFNLTRQLGGSVGIAILTTLLARRQTYHYAMLSERISEYNPLATARLATLTSIFVMRGSTSTVAHRQALASIAGTVQLQAAVMSFNDVFRVVAWVFVASLPLLFLLGKPPRESAVAE